MMKVLKKVIRDLRLDKQFMQAKAIVAISIGTDDEVVLLVSFRLACKFAPSDSLDAIMQNLFKIAIERAFKSLPLALARREAA